MNYNPAMAYKNNAINTASPAELTLMLYDAAIKFCNIAIVAIENKDYAKANTNIQKAERIITELRATLDFKYAVANDFENIYSYIYELLLNANLKKDTESLESALTNIREIRDIWKEIMKENKLKVG